MTLPSSIEASLLEAGFTGTELLILKRLLEQDALTLRELALKTGKSTGVLDQAAKKLLKKGIIAREEINGSPKFTLGSLQSVVLWMEKDMKAKQEQLKRRHENFESFVASISVDRARPDMKHFHGEEGIKQAYIELLEMGKELLVYMPMDAKEEDDPLREFRVQHFRMRRQREIFSRVIAHDGPLGRRFVSRDPFEYRKTLLVQESAVPIPFEKIIAGNTVACFDHASHSACFIQFPALAASERGMFEGIWRNTAIQAGETSAIPVPEISLKTKLFSQMREFYVSRSSIVALGIIALLSAGIAFGAYRVSLVAETQKIRERVRSIAATGALQFDGGNLENLRALRDIQRPEYAMAVEKLQAIRNQNRDVMYAYIWRVVEKNKLVEFVADADSFDPALIVDNNQDGVLDEADENTFPGMAYDISMEDIDVTNLENPHATKEPIPSQWGTFISGYAPIKSLSGSYILGVDVIVDRLNESVISWSTRLAVFAASFVLLSLLYIFPLVSLWRAAGGSLRSPTLP